MSLNADPTNPNQPGNRPTPMQEAIAALAKANQEMAKTIDLVRSVRRQVEIDELNDAGFGVCEACDGPVEKRFAHFCDYCEEEDQAVKDELEEDFKLNEADRMNDMAVERGLW